MTTPLIRPEPRRILVFRALFLGDLLCALPALGALRARFPGAEITMVGLPWARELVDRLPAVDRLVAFPGYPGLPEVPVEPGRVDAFLAGLRAERYDLAIQMHGSGGVTNGLVAGVKAARTLGYASPGDDRLTDTLAWDEGEHEVRRWLRLVVELGADDAETGIDVPTTTAERAEADRLLAGVSPAAGPLVGLHVGAKDAARRWPAARFAALGDALAEAHDARLVLTGGPAERGLADEVRAAMRAEPIDLVGATDLGTLFAVVGRLDLLVTNDTGASHVAAATRTPSVVLFGPTLPSRWAPLDRALHPVVEAPAGVGPGVGRDEALAHLPLAPVLAAAHRMLSRAVVAETAGAAGTYLAVAGAGFTGVRAADAGLAGTRGLGGMS